MFFNQESESTMMSYSQVSWKFCIIKNLHIAFTLCLRLLKGLFFLAYFGVRIAHAGTSGLFSYLVFSYLIFTCASLRSDIPKKTQEFLKILNHFCMRNLYISQSVPPKLLFFYKNLFSILNFTASDRFRTAATSKMEPLCDSS